MNNANSKPALFVSFAIGDALGMPFETLKPSNLKLSSWDGETYLESKFHNLKPGQTTDDTQMLLAQAKGILYSPTKETLTMVKNTQKEYLNWFNENPTMGQNTKNSLEKLSQGIPWFICSLPPENINHTCGNGTIMRVPALVKYYSSICLHELRKALNPSMVKETIKCTTDKMLEHIFLDSLVTHRDLNDYQYHCAAIYAKCLFSKIVNNGAGFYFTDEITFLEKITQSTESSWITKKTLAEQLKLVLDTLIQIQSVENKNDKDNVVMQILTNNFYGFDAVSTLCACLLVAYSYQNNYLKALQVSIRSGGDTDTKAALTGILVAAMNSFKLEDLPKKLVEGLDKSTLKQCIFLEEKLEERY